MRFLTTAEYDAVLLGALTQTHRLSPDQASDLIASRWPMDAYGLIAEANGRGLLILLGDVAAFIAEHVDESAATVDNVLFVPPIAEHVFQWSVDTARATLTPNGELLQRADTDRVLNRIARRAAAPMN